MRVIGFDEPGGPRSYARSTPPEPAVGPGQLRIRVRAAAVGARMYRPRVLTTDIRFRRFGSYQPGSV